MTVGQRFAYSAGLVLAFVAATAAADSVTIGPSKDNTLYEDSTGGLSNGAGEHSFAGRAGGLRRAVLAFDVAASVPAGATIQSAKLTVYCSRLPFFNPPPALCELHRLLANWGEGTSDAGDPGGTGTTATTGDATWIHTFYNTSLWFTAGGDFTGTTSSSASVAALGSVAFVSTAQMVADVQSWLDTPANNYGWLLRGDESQQNSRRFETRESPVPEFRPQLQIDYMTGIVGVAPRAWAGVKELYR